MQFLCGILTARLHIAALERVQKFALKIAFKSWGDSYETLLLRSGLQQLLERRSYLRLCYLFQIINGNFVFPNPPIVRRQLEHNLRNVTHHLMQPFARTSAYQYIHSSQTQSLTGIAYLPPSAVVHQYLPSSITLLLICNITFYMLCYCCA